MIGAPVVVAAALTVTVPMRVIHNLPFVQTRIGGSEPQWFLIDTGTNPSVIDLRLAHALHLHLAASGTGSGGGTQKIAFSETHLPAVTVGSFSERNVEALTTDLSSLRLRLGLRFEGVLGYSFLRNHAVQVDYGNRRLRIWPNGNVRLNSKCTYGTKFDYIDDVVIRTAQVNGHPAGANLDTGSSSYLAFTPASIGKLGLSQQAHRARQSTGQGYNGQYASLKGTVEQFGIGPMRFPIVPATFWKPHTGHDSRPWDVNVGGAILSKVRPLFDYVHHFVYFNTCR